MNKLLSDNKKINLLNSSLSLKEYLKLVIGTSLDFKKNNRNNQILMHLFQNKSKNLSLINKNKNNNKNIKIKCNCCNLVKNSFSSLRNHLITIKHIFLSKSLIYLRFLHLKQKKICNTNTKKTYYLKCNCCNTYGSDEIFQKHLISKDHLSRVLKLFHNLNFINKNSTKSHLSFKINKLIKIIIILVVKKKINLNSNYDTLVKKCNNKSIKEKKNLNVLDVVALVL